jgi:hypothetical protein
LAEQHGDSLAIIRYHTSDIFYQYNPEEQGARKAFYGANIPRLYLDGVVDCGQLYFTWGGYIPDRYGVSPHLDIELVKDYDYHTREVDLTVRMTALEHIPEEWDLCILAALTESDLLYGGYTQNQAMRDMIPSSEGDTITIQQGQTKERSYTFTVDEIIDDGNSELVVFVQDFSGTKTVLQAAKTRLAGVSLSCETLTPLVCRGKNLYFKVTVDNTTSGNVSGELKFRGYAGYDCNPVNTLVTIPRNRTYRPGLTTDSYYFQVPRAAGPGPYSLSVGGALGDYELFCCMNVDIVQCEPWKVGDNTEWGLIDAGGRETALSVTTQLYRSHPNPFNGSTSIRYRLTEGGNVTLKVYDITGRLIATLADGFQNEGEHVATWYASDAPSGIYLYKLKASDFSETRRMSLVR